MNLAIASFDATFSCYQNFDDYPGFQKIDLDVNLEKQMILLV